MEHRCAQRKKTDIHVEFAAVDEIVHPGRIEGLSDLGARIITADDISEYGSIIDVMLSARDETLPAARPSARGFVTWLRHHAFGLIWITEDAAPLLLGSNKQRTVAS